ncbi:amyloid fiber anchoring/assembly protein TapA [Sporosarcina sp. NPDC096371]|uniref:amyloid fiber anchoring/assembly protein TapA n=1 Tax=Sporosarcina sp. NPDC096371 TaxID=3364530 RepID=UPI0038115DF4
MQKSKLEKMKNIRKHVLMVKILAICYFSYFAVIYLTSYTEAQFTNARVDEQVIQAGEWWDGSSLVFNSTENQLINQCEPVELAVEIKNDSLFAMYGPSKYEVHQVFLEEDVLLEGNRVSDEEMEIEIIGAGETATLLYTADTPGDYVFVAHQRPTYDNDEIVQPSVTSGVITVTCVEEEEEVSNESVSPTEPETDKGEEPGKLICLKEQNKDGEYGIQGQNKDKRPVQSDCIPEQDKDEDNKDFEKVPEKNKEEEMGDTPTTGEQDTKPTIDQSQSPDEKDMEEQPTEGGRTN